MFRLSSSHWAYMYFMYNIRRSRPAQVTSLIPPIFETCQISQNKNRVRTRQSYLPRAWNHFSNWSLLKDGHFWPQFYLGNTTQEGHFSNFLVMREVTSQLIYLCIYAWYFVQGWWLENHVSVPKWKCFFLRVGIANAKKWAGQCDFALQDCQCEGLPVRKSNCETV